MRYEVSIQVKTTDSMSDTLQSLRETWEFNDDSKFALAGAAYAVHKTAEGLTRRIENAIEGSTDQELLGIEHEMPHRAPK